MAPKFRFWYEREDFYPDENYMRDVWKIEYLSNGEIVLNDDYTFNPHTNVAENSYAKTRIYLMQSTGLKDKNGIEIYEGDILPSNCNVFSKGELKIQVVRFLDGGFRRLSVYQEWGPYGAYGEAEIGEWHDGGCLSEEEARNTKVLGNIYENLELLEVEKCQG